MYKTVFLGVIAGILAVAFGTQTPAQDATSRPDSRPTTSRPAKMSPGPYTATTCPVSGQKLGAMGAPIRYDLDGREILLCCKGCIKKFDKDPKKYAQRADEAIIKAQLPYYPTSTCVVSGQPLSEDGSAPIDFVYNNRLVRLCCKGCRGKIKDNPAGFMQKLDELIIAKYAPSYPLDVCVVSGKKLSSMGKPLNLVVGNRLVRLCCGGCKKKVLKDPGTYLSKLPRQKGK